MDRKNDNLKFSPPFNPMIIGTLLDTLVLNIMTASFILDSVVANSTSGFSFENVVEFVTIVLIVA